MPSRWRSVVDQARAIATRRRAEALDESGQRAEAFAAYQEAAVAWEDTHPVISGSLWVRAARQAALMEDRPAQLSAAQHALDLLSGRSTGVTPPQRQAGLMALVLVADALHWLGRLSEAEVTARKAIAAAEAAADRETLCIAYGILANVVIHCGRPVEALGATTRVVALARDADDPLQLAAALTDHATTLTALAQYGPARDAITEAVAVADRVEDPRMADRLRLSSLVAASRIHRVGGDTADAIRMAERAMALCDRYGLREQYLEATMAWALARASDDIDAAIAATRDVHEQELALGMSHLAGRAANNLAMLHAKAARFDEARTWASVGVRLSGGDLDGRGAASFNLARLALAAGDLAGGRAALVEAIADWEDLRRTVTDDRQYVDVLEQQAMTYRLLQACRLADGDVTGGLEAAEQARGLSLLRRLRAHEPARHNPLARGFTADAALALAADRHVGFLIYSAVPSFDTPYDEGSMGLQAWYVDATGITHARTARDELTPPPGMAVAQAEVDAFVGLTRDVVVPTPIMDGHEIVGAVDWLSQVLIGQLDGALRRSPARRLVVVPDLDLDRVPFGALRLRSGQCLADRWALSVVPAVAVFAELDGRPVVPPREATPLVFGNPAAPTEPIALGLPVPRLAPLVHAEREARHVAAEYGASPFLGERATRRAALAGMPGRALIHFATHGLYGSDDGVTPGALCLTPTDADDGYLRADDIARTDLSSCRVVVLSACRTGWGHSTHEGTLGLARAFLGAGARAVVVSLWPVDDAATADLMINMHGLLRAGLPIGEALRQAMCAARDQGAPLVDWASFTIVGDADATVPAVPGR
ncbi:CHAT domain-containing protein [Luedemannella helvata]|uniref:CHAT domain-containing protein n=1 Tax=Luedemannella helvata TaxID=349315 RepID=A0ABP4VX39_9ACTN